jgi:hypothetical protein
MFHVWQFLSWAFLPGAQGNTCDCTEESLGPLQVARRIYLEVVAGNHRGTQRVCYTEFLMFGGRFRALIGGTMTVVAMKAPQRKRLCPFPSVVH